MGSYVGASVGDGVGAYVGSYVGASVGDGVGAYVGSYVGASVGDGVGPYVGSFVGLGVGSGRSEAGKSVLSILSVGDGVGSTGHVGFVVLIVAQLGSGAFVGLSVGQSVGFLVFIVHRFRKFAGLSPIFL